MTWSVIGARGEIGPVDPFLQRLREEAGKRGFEVQAFDPDMVFGEDHLHSALEHADRAFHRGTSRASERMMEALRYAAGERQIAAAIEKMGVKAQARGLVLLVDGEDDVEGLLAALGLERDDGLVAGDVAMLPRFGFSEAEIATVPPPRVFDLVLERVALVDAQR